MPPIKYLIIVEIERTGFITEFKNTYEEASASAENLMNYTGGLDSETVKKKVISFMRQRNYISYHINGNQLYFGKVRRSLSDGIITISIAEIDMKTFCLKTLIRERENHSIVFDDEINDELLEKFPNIDLIAN